MDTSRYACQIPLDGFGPKAQSILKKSKVLIVGMGGLGCPASLYLTSSGVGVIGIADYDIVAKKNLHRQVIYSEDDIGKPKVQIAKKVLTNQNPEVVIDVYEKKVSSNNALEIIRDYDVVLDCTDNFSTRYLLNDACVLLDRPLVYGAIFQYEGQAAIWNSKNKDNTRSPNYRDIFPEVNGQIPNCADGGVIPTVAGIIGCIQATEVIKYLIGIDSRLRNNLLIFDVKSMTSYSIKLPKRTSTNIHSLPVISDVEEISSDELKNNFNKYKLIDVRSRQEHQDKNIGGQNIPLDELGANASKMNFEKPMVFYCVSGKRSAVAAKTIKAMRPDIDVLSLKGGLDNW